jgi:hypothetical protein
MFAIGLSSTFAPALHRLAIARPGGNVTGLSALATELNTKRLEVIKDAVPKLAIGLRRLTRLAMRAKRARWSTT